MSFPHFMDKLSYFSDPEGYTKHRLSSEDIEGRKQSIKASLEKLRSRK